MVCSKCGETLADGVAVCSKCSAVLKERERATSSCPMEIPRPPREFPRPKKETPPKENTETNIQTNLPVIFSAERKELDSPKAMEAPRPKAASHPTSPKETPKPRSAYQPPKQAETSKPRSAYQIPKQKENPKTTVGAQPTKQQTPKSSLGTQNSKGAYSSYEDLLSKYSDKSNQPNASKASNSTRNASDTTGRRVNNVPRKNKNSTPNQAVPETKKKSKLPIIIVIIFLILAAQKLLSDNSEKTDQSYYNEYENTTIVQTVASLTEDDETEFTEHTSALDDAFVRYDKTMYRRVYSLSGLDMYDKPDITSRVITNIPDLTMVAVVGYSEKTPGWVYIKHSGNDGWVKSRYLESLSVTRSKPTAVYTTSQRVYTNNYFTVTMTDGLNLRTEPSVDGGDTTVIIEIPYNETVRFINYNSDKSWAKVEYDGMVGWVSAKNIKYSYSE